MIFPTNTVYFLVPVVVGWEKEVERIPLTRSQHCSGTDHLGQSGRVIHQLNN